MEQQEFLQYKRQVEESLNSSPIRDWILKQQRQKYTPWQILSAMKLSGWEESLAQGLIELVLTGSILNPANRPEIHRGAGTAVSPQVKIATPTLDWKTHQLLAPPLNINGVTASLNTPPCQVISHYQKPEIVFLADFLTPNETLALQESVKRNLEAVKPHFLGFKQTYIAAKQSALLESIQIRIAHLFAWVESKMDMFQLSALPVGAYIEPHYDFFHPDHPDTKLLTARGGQRVSTFIVFLEEAIGGGALQFPELGISFMPKAGSAVFFSYPELSSASKTLNGIMPVTHGTLSYLSTWFRTEEIAA